MTADGRQSELLVGRSSELAQLGAIMAELARGRGWSVLIEGEPGIGKSALAGAMLAGVDRSAVEVAYGECDELGRRFPLAVMLAALGVDPDATDPLRAEAAAALAGQDGRRDAGGFPTVSGDVAVSIERLAELVDHSCAARPLLVLVDDLQFADEASLRLWSQLSRAVEQLPLALVGLCRPSPPRPELAALRDELARSAHGELVSLQRLSDEEVVDLAGRRMNGRPGTRLCALLTSAAGNPLYVREIVDAAVRSGALSASDGVVELRADAGADLRGAAPTSLADAITDRLDFLSHRCRDVLTIASVHGNEFSPTDVSSASGLPLEQVDEALREAAQAGVVEPGEGRLQFRHGLIRQALYDLLPEALRLAITREVAMHLIRSGAPLERTADAVLRALQGADGWEMDWLFASADELAYRAPGVAVELFNHALSRGDDEENRVAGLEDHLAAVLLHLARFEEAAEISRRILAECADPERRGRGAWTLASALYGRGSYEEAIAVAATAAADVRTARPWSARLLGVQAGSLVNSGRTDEGERAAQRALAEAERQGEDPFAMSHALAMLAVSRGLTNSADSPGILVYIDRALEIIGDNPQLVSRRINLLMMRAYWLQGLDRFDERTTTLSQARALAERSVPGRLPVLHVHFATTAFNHGRWEDALTELDACYDLPSRADEAVFGHGLAAVIAAHQGDVASAEQHLREQDRRLERFRKVEPCGLVARAYLAEQTGAPGRGAEILSVILRPSDVEFWGSRTEWLPQLARMALAVGDLDTGRRALTATCEDRDGDPTPSNQATYDWCRGLVEDDPVPILAAVKYFSCAGQWRVDAAHALEDAAFVLARRGESDRARDTLTRVLPEYADMGARWDAQRAAARLRALGVRLGVRGPRQRPRTGWESLSETERRVAGLVTEGLSNPDIAARLQLSRRTVQTHVSHIMGKLGVQSRREIGVLSPSRPAETTESI